MTFPEIIKAVIELGFPVAVAIYLLWYQSKQIERFRQTIHEVKIGLYLILDRLDIVQEYDKAVQEYRDRRKDKDE